MTWAPAAGMLSVRVRVIIHIIGNIYPDPMVNIGAD